MPVTAILIVGRPNVGNPRILTERPAAVSIVETRRGLTRDRIAYLMGRTRGRFFFFEIVDTAAWAIIADYNLSKQSRDEERTANRLAT